MNMVYCMVTHPHDQSSYLSRRLAVQTNLLQEVEAVGGEERVRGACPHGCAVQKGPDGCLHGARVRDSKQSPSLQTFAKAG